MNFQYISKYRRLPVLTLINAKALFSGSWSSETSSWSSNSESSWPTRMIRGSGCVPEARECFIDDSVVCALAHACSQPFCIALESAKIEPEASAFRNTLKYAGSMQ